MSTIDLTNPPATQKVAVCNPDGTTPLNLGFGGSAISGTNPLAVQQRAAPFGALGIYSASVLSGTMAAGLAADSEILQFRWTDATNLALIHEVTLDGLDGSATAFTAGFGRVYLTIARSFTVAGTGGNTATLTTNNGKLRASMGTTLLGELRSASTAALGAGTKTLDALSIGQEAFSFGTATSVNYVPAPIKLFNTDGVNSHPIVLTTNEGLIVRAVVPATGTWQFGVTIKWSEVASF
jgi:hypothetical protein